MKLSRRGFFGLGAAAAVAPVVAKLPVAAPEMVEVPILAGRTAPVLSFINDTNTGMYATGAGKFGFATNGIQRGAFTAEQLAAAAKASLDWYIRNPS